VALHTSGTGRVNVLLAQLLKSAARALKSSQINDDGTVIGIETSTLLSTRACNALVRSL